MRLVDAGFKHIQVASFVHPGKVPQMADAEMLLSALPEIPGVAFSALALNMAGVERAIALQAGPYRGFDIRQQPAQHEEYGHGHGCGPENGPENGRFIQKTRHARPGWHTVRIWQRIR